MTDLPGAVGYMEVVFYGLVGLFDTVDPGNDPDAEDMLASVEFTPSVTNIVEITEAGLKTFISLATTTHPLSGGVLEPNDEEAGTLRLVAPMQVSISPRNWFWTARFIPTATQDWKEFSISFSGSPGDTVDLGSVYSIGLAAGNLELLNMWFKQLAKVPEQIMTGTVVYDGDKLDTAEVLWPDGVEGLLTVDTYHAATEKAASWHITHDAVTYTQPAITFNGDGEPTSIPDIVVS